jgi:hypothetical protein
MTEIDPRTIGLILVGMFAVGGLIVKVLDYMLAPIILGILILGAGGLFLYAKLKDKIPLQILSGGLITLLLGMLVYTVV